MNIKKIFILSFIAISYFLICFSTKTSAVSYCNYGSIDLVLPVTIGVDTVTIDKMYPFELNKNIYDHDELYVYDRNSCLKSLNIPYYDPLRYYSQSTYYYRYNGETTYVSYIGSGAYSYKDYIAPSIYTTQDMFTIELDKEFDFEDVTNFIVSFDETDGSLIEELIYENYSENKHKIGTYSAIYKACDNSNNCSQITIKINVVDKKAPTINGINNIVSYMSHPVSNLDIMNMLTAMDNYDGNITHKIEIYSSNYTTEIPGIYFTSFIVKDSSNNTIEDPFKVTISLQDDINPQIEGPTLFKSKLSSPISISFIMSNMIVYDNTDAEAYKNLYVISDEYTNNIYRIGTYNIFLGAYDMYTNEASPYKIEVVVIDDVIPTIEGKNSYNSYLSSPISITTIKNNLTFHDNYDGNLYNKIEVCEDTYSLNKNNLGIYYVIFSIKDSSNNTSEPFKVEIITHDDIAPILEGVNFYKTTINKKIDELSIKLSLNAHDNIDGDLTQHIVLNENNYSNHFSTPGIYFLTYYVSDYSGNISTFFKVKIIVNENLTFLEKINNSSIYLSTNDCKTKEEILKILNIDTLDFNDINVIEDTYTKNYNIVNDYTMTFEIVNTDYTKESFTIKIQTYDDKDTNTKTVNTPVNKTKKETIFSQIISFFKNMLSSITIFFKNLFS